MHCSVARRVGREGIRPDWLLAVWAVMAQVAGASPDEFNFVLQTQSLASALERYAVITDQTILFSDELVAGRLSAPVHGRLTARAALDAMLAGTGLVADNSGGRLGHAFVLKRESDVAVSPGLDRGYDGFVQLRVWRALCADARTAPGGYRAALRLNVDPDGRLVAPRLLGSTGSVERDRAIVAILHGLPLDEAPPPGLKQPLLLVILSQERIAGRACEQGGT